MALDARPVAGHPYDPEVEDWLEAISPTRSPRCGSIDGANATVAAPTAAASVRVGRQVAVPVDARG